MKNLLLTSLLLSFSCMAVMAQERFAFNDINYMDKKMQINSAEDTPAEIVWDKGPFEVVHQRFDQEISISIPNVFDVLDFEMINMSGLQVPIKAMKSEQTVYLKLSELPKGLYLLKLRTADRNYTAKVQHGI